MKDDKRRRNLKERRDNFLYKSHLRYNNYYNYSKVVYINNDTKVEIICPVHGAYFQLPDNHLKYPCAKCDFFTNDKIDKKFNEFLSESNKIHNNKYRYIKESFRSLSEKILIICPVHGEFYQLAYRHKNGTECRKCDITKRALSQKLDSENAISILRERHLDKYDYSKSVYSKYGGKIKIICPYHGEFIQRYDVHVRGCGCPKCNISLVEQKIIRFLIENGIKYNYNHSFDDCKNINNLKFDFYLPDSNTCIEFDGIQHFKSIEYFGGDERFNYMRKCDEIKNKFCIDNNINLIRISYEDIDSTNIILNNNIKQIII